MKDLADHFDREAASYPTHIGTDYIQRRKWALVEAHASAHKDALLADEACVALLCSELEAERLAREGERLSRLDGLTSG